jgi:hypothetical protein
MGETLKHRRRSQRQTRQPIGVAIVKPKPAKAQAKAVLHSLFHGWQHDNPQALAERVDAIRRSAFERVLSTREWAELDAMRDALKVQQRFQRATQEDHHG